MVAGFIDTLNPFNELSKTICKALFTMENSVYFVSKLRECVILWRSVDLILRKPSYVLTVGLLIFTRGGTRMNINASRNCEITRHSSLWACPSPDGHMHCLSS